jgi:16S rRNA (guanine1207-N2)-methyltransferase
VTDAVVEVVLGELETLGALGAGSGAGSGASIATVETADGEFARALAAVAGRAAGARIRAFSDTGVAADALAGLEAEVDEVSALDASLFAGATVIAGRLPKSLAELDELAEVAAAHADDGVTLILGGREKFLNRSMNEQLARHFGEVRATRGHRKARALVATLPRRGGEPTYPREARIRDLDLEVCAHGAAFAGPTLDLGTRALIEALCSAELDAADVVDLGCGTGILAAWFAREHPAARVVATDRSWAACASAAATARANGLDDRIEVVRATSGAGLADASSELVLLNPPFHDGHEVQQGMANDLFRAAARVLRDGGQLVTVFNSHLRHREHLERIVGPTRQLARTPKFTVTLTTRR